MTRLRQPERLVLDTLVAAGVARSRSEALAWSVRLVGKQRRGLAGRAALRRWSRSSGFASRAPTSPSDALVPFVLARRGH